MSAESPFDVFDRLIRRALGHPEAADEALELQVFESATVPGAVVVKFFPEELAESLHAVYVPAGRDADGSVMERLHGAVATHEDLVPVADPERQRARLSEVLALLERYMDATEPGADEGDASGEPPDEDDDPREADDAAEADDASAPAGDAGNSPARIEFGPIEALEALGAAHDRREARREALGSDAEEPADEDLPDDRPTFRALALDVLSGVPRPHGSGPDLADSYEVWAFRHDPVATVVLRFFDGGRAVVLGALAPVEEAFDPGRFFAAAYQLLAVKAPTAMEGRPEGRLSDLEPLDVVAALTRLGRALGAEHTAEVHELTTELLGEATEETSDAYERLRLLDPRAPESAGALFAAIARDVVEIGGEVLWTRRKERASEPRIEVLEHRAHPGALLLVDFGRDDEPVEVAGYLPEGTGAPRDFAADARRLLAERTIFSDPQPLADGGPFRRVPNSQAVFAVESALESLEDGTGTALAFRDAGPVPAED